MRERSPDTLWAVVPVKVFDRAKQRLAAVLTPEERVGLAGAMLTDVLAALSGAFALAGTVVVTGDAHAARIAQRYGARIIRDREERGLNAAVVGAAREAAAAGAGILIVPGDVPLITAADVDAIVTAHGSRLAVTVVPAASDSGTNALACSPADVIPFQFGDDSFRRHQRAAQMRGLRPRVVTLPNLACDIDRPGDLQAFVARPSPTRTYRYLESSGIVARLRSMADAGAPEARAVWGAG